MTDTLTDVTITYREKVPENQQDSAFHTWNPGAENLAVVEYKGRKLFIDRVGDMYLSIPNIPEHLDVADEEVYSQNWEETVIRYTNDLLSFGIDTDEKLHALDDRFSNNGYQIWHMNSWFEVYSEEDDFGYEVYHEFYEAVDFALAAIKADEYWDNLHNPENYVV